MTPIYFIDGKVIAKSNDIVVYEMDGVRYLEQGPGHNLWADSDEIEQLAEQINVRPRGECLEIGLGLGVASEYILSNPNVDRLSTVEINKDVISTYAQLNLVPRPLNHYVVNMDGYEYIIQTVDSFDFIFLDFYSLIDEDTLPEIKKYVEASKRILKTGGEIMGWFDPSTPHEFAEEFFKLFNALYIGDRTYEIF